jgi:hypothetical protein
MRKLLLLLVATFAFHAIPVAFADDKLPEIAPVDDPVVEPLPDNVPAE